MAYIHTKKELNKLMKNMKDNEGICVRCETIYNLKERKKRTCYCDFDD